MKNLLFLGKAFYRITRQGAYPIRNYDLAASELCRGPLIRKVDERVGHTALTGVTRRAAFVGYLVARPFLMHSDRDVGN
jgi:hypothetical protein